MKKECKRHDWRVGSFIGYITPLGMFSKKGINIWCYKCGKKIKAYYSFYAKNKSSYKVKKTKQGDKK